jgi:chromosome segregation ATPase
MAVYGCLKLFKQLFNTKKLLFKRLFTSCETFIKTINSYIIMFNWLFKKTEKNELEQHKGAVQTALNNVKQDMTSLSKWIKHLDTQDSQIKNEVEELSQDMLYIRKEIEEIKEMIAQNNEQKVEVIAPIIKQRQTATPKQTAVLANQTAVQTTVQAAFFTKLSLSEKQIMSILMDSELKLSYEDLSALTGKDMATLRGQVNSIKQKCEGLIEEQIEKNGKKRLYVPEEIKAMLLRKAKNSRKRGKIRENESYSA